MALDFGNSFGPECPNGRESPACYKDLLYTQKQRNTKLLTDRVVLVQDNIRRSVRQEKESKLSYKIWSREKSAVLNSIKANLFLLFTGIKMLQSSQCRTLSYELYGRFSDKFSITSHDSLWFSQFIKTEKPFFWWQIESWN